MDFALLERELRCFLNAVLHGDFFEQFNVESSQRVIRDIAISGNGEPTSLKDFDKAVRLIGEIACDFALFPGSKFVLISNGSLIHQPVVQAGLAELNRYHGELWFKLDSASERGRKLLNNSHQNQQKLLKNLEIAARHCPTKLQTCMLHYRHAWSDSERHAYLELLKELRERGIKLQQIMLYSLARRSYQPEANQLGNMSPDEMDALAADIKALGYDVSVSY